MKRLFVYGTLRGTTQIRNLVGRQPSRPFAARLTGYRRHETDYGFPVALPDPEGAIDGVLWRGLTNSEILRLDSYEGGLGNMYNRIEVRVELDHGESELAWFYVGVAAAWELSAEGIACRPA